MKFLSRLFPADMWAGRLALLVIAAFFKLLIFDVIWCSGPTSDLLLICNLMYCRTYFTAIPLDSYLLAGNLSDFKASVVDSMRWYDILLPLSTLAAIIVCFPTNATCGNFC